MLAGPYWRQDLAGSPLERLRDAVSPELVLARLRREWPALHDRGNELERLIVERVHPQSDQGFVIQYEAHLRERGTPVCQSLIAELRPGDVHDYAEAVRQKLVKSRRGQRAAASHPANLFVIDDLGLLFRTPGMDERIPGLRLLHDTDYAMDMLAGALSPENAFSVVRPQLIGHRLGKRCVVRFDLQAKNGATVGSLIAKMYKVSTDKGLATHRATSDLHDRFGKHPGAIAVPRPIHYSEDLAVSLLEDVDGQPLEISTTSPPRMSTCFW